MCLIIFLWGPHEFLYSIKINTQAVKIRLICVLLCTEHEFGICFHLFNIFISEYMNLCSL